MKLFRLSLLWILVSVGAAFAADHDSVLPKDFGGWHMQGTAKLSTDPATADAANAALLKEYGITGFESATYIREDGRKLAIKAAKFGDASGAFGAFTFYNQPQMQP